MLLKERDKLTGKIVMLVKGKQISDKMLCPELAAKAGMSEKMLQRRMRNPEQLTLKQCWMLEDALKLDRGTIGGVR